MQEKNDLWMEFRLNALSPDLHDRFINSFVATGNLLEQYKKTFPTFADHTFFHSMNVARYANLITAHEAERMTAEDIYVLLMAVYLHDIGMGITDEMFDEFSKEIDMSGYKKGFLPDKLDRIRAYHQEFSACFVKKYWRLFDIPDESFVHCIAQVCRGHRKIDLFDETEYPKEYKLSNGGIVHLAYLGPIIRLSDEMDMTSDRHPDILYGPDYYEYHEADPKGALVFSAIAAIKELEVDENAITLTPETTDETLLSEIKNMAEELQNKLDYCRKAVNGRTGFTIPQEKIIATGLL